MRSGVRVEPGDVPAPLRPRPSLSLAASVGRQLLFRPPRRAGRTAPQRREARGRASGQVAGRRLVRAGHGPGEAVVHNSRPGSQGGALGPTLKLKGEEVVLKEEEVMGGIV